MFTYQQAISNETLPYYGGCEPSFASAICCCKGRLPSVSRDGRDGKDGTPGVAGPAGPPWASEILHTAYQELRETLKDDILNDTRMAVTVVTNVSVSELEAEVQSLKENVSHLSSIVEDLRQNLTEFAMVRVRE